jgi:two-component system, chemotaxis family, chemotaxis protein CheY
VNVLIADDNLLTAEVLATLFRLRGDAARHAPDGAAALDQLDGGFRPDVLVLDLLMPRMCGFKLLEALRSDPARAGLPVLVLTGAGDDGLARLEGVPGPLEVLRKPADPSEIVAAACRLAGVCETVDIDR